MRRAFLILSALLLTGCASESSEVSGPVRTYLPARATALAFDPPVLAGTPRLDLSREDRGPSAFVGFEQSSTTFYSLRVDDWFMDVPGGGSGGGSNSNAGNRDTYSRRSISETVGVSQR